MSIVSNTSYEASCFGYTGVYYVDFAYNYKLSNTLISLSNGQIIIVNYDDMCQST